MNWSHKLPPEQARKRPASQTPKIREDRPAAPGEFEDSADDHSGTSDLGWTGGVSSSMPDGTAAQPLPKPQVVADHVLIFIRGHGQ